MMLKVWIKDLGVEVYSYFSKFQIDDESTKFTLHVSGFSDPDGTGCGDSFSQHSGLKFTTYDSDNDGDNTKNLATYYLAGNWYDGGFVFLLF